MITVSASTAVISRYSEFEIGSTNGVSYVNVEGLHVQNAWNGMNVSDTGYYLLLARNRIASVAAQGILFGGDDCLIQSNFVDKVGQWLMFSR